MQYFKLHFYYLYYGDLWLEIFDVTSIIALGYHKPHPYNMVNLISKIVCVCALTTPLTIPLSISLLSGLHIPWDTMILKSGQVITKMTSKCSSERKRHISFNLNQRLELIKLNEQGTSKTERGQTLWLLCQTVKLLIPKKGN